MAQREYSVSVMKNEGEKKYVYLFGESVDKDIVGGKGEGLSTMVKAGIPVPPGFTISTEMCIEYLNKEGRVPTELNKQMLSALEGVEKATGKKFGDSHNPLLVSVRSGAKFSMPGMMDTILNLGLNDKVVEGLSQLTQDERFVYDAYRRFIQMFGNVAMGINKDIFEHILEFKKDELGIIQDVELDAAALKEIVQKYKAAYKEVTQEDFPQEPLRQLTFARDAVFRSWNTPRAITYRKREGIPDTLGTAVNVQAMVFGNLGTISGTGVGFTRDPATGERISYGEYLMNAQGEDVVAGIRTPQPIARLAEELPDVYRQLREITTSLEKYYHDVQDFEFTVENGKLWMLQTRRGKRTAPAALRIAVDMFEEGLITAEEAAMRLEPGQLDQLLHPTFDPQGKAEALILAQGIDASPGAAIGEVVFSAARAKELLDENPRAELILVRPETTPDDIVGITASQGILTSRGGKTSHAAVVARGWGKPCVTGTEQIVINEQEKCFSVGNQIIREGNWISIDGATGEVMLGKVKKAPSDIVRGLVDHDKEAQNSELYQYYIRFMALLKRKLGMWTNADYPKDTQAARALGAEGVGLVRTEHMFFEEKRVFLVQQMLLSAMLGNTTITDEAIKRILPLQKGDFKGIFESMDGLPVTIRLLDPPVHEFLPKVDEVEKVSQLASILNTPTEKLIQMIADLHEENPMLGHRGVRLLITTPAIARMQVQAIIEAAIEVSQEGVVVKPKIMVPLVACAEEFAAMRDIIREKAKEVISEKGVKLDYHIGAMIELGRAPLIADKLVTEGCEFFSFGTNDLTQTSYGYSRDDAEKMVIGSYIDKGILSRNPFVTVDFPSVGVLIALAKKLADTAGNPLSSPLLKRGDRGDSGRIDIGICGEHGGDPETITFLHMVGLDYASASPYRVPIGLLATAQAALRQEFELPLLNAEEAAERLTGVISSVRAWKGHVIRDEAEDRRLLDSFSLQPNCLRTKAGIQVQAIALVNTAGDAERAISLSIEQVNLDITSIILSNDNISGLIRKLIITGYATDDKSVINTITREIREALTRAMTELVGQGNFNAVSVTLLDTSLDAFLRFNPNEMEQVAQDYGISVEELEGTIGKYRENNPLLGERGVRLAMTRGKEIYQAQIEAIFDSLSDKGSPSLQINLPFVSDIGEITGLKSMISEIAEKSGGKAPAYTPGAVIAIPKAALIASDIATEVDTLIFNTTDLTQTTWGISWADASVSVTKEGFLSQYIEQGILANDPFEVLDVEGVGVLIADAITEAHKANPNLKFSAIGSQLGDATSISFLEWAGIDSFIVPL